MPGRDPQAYPKLLTLQAISTNLISRIQNTPQSATEALGLQGTRRNSRRLGFRKLRPPSTLARSYHTRIGAGAVQLWALPLSQTGEHKRLRRKLEPMEEGLELRGQTAWRCSVREYGFTVRATFGLHLLTLHQPSAPRYHKATQHLLSNRRLVGLLHMHISCPHVEGSAAKCIFIHGPWRPSAPSHAPITTSR